MKFTEFKRFADENNIVPVSTEIYSQMISDSVKYAKIKKVLDKIRAEIEKPLREERFFDTADAKAQYIALNWCIEIIDKYRESEDKE